MKSAGSRQLALAFADSPTGGRDRRTQDESRGKRYLLHTAKANNRKDPATSTAAADSERAMESVASAHNLAQALLNVSRNSNTWFATQWTPSYDLWGIANPPAEVSDQLSLAF